MNRKEIEQFVYALIDVIWEKHQDDKIPDFYHPNLQGQYNDDLVSFDQLKAKVKLFAEHLPGLEVDVKDLLIEDHSFAIHANQNFTKDGREASIHTILIAHLKDGKIDRYIMKTEMPLDFNLNV